jgi:hypothetical protein
MDSHFHGNDKKKRENDMREGGQYFTFTLHCIVEIAHYTGQGLFRKEERKIYFDKFVLKCFK